MRQIRETDPVICCKKVRQQKLQKLAVDTESLLRNTADTIVEIIADRKCSSTVFSIYDDLRSLVTLDSISANFELQATLTDFLPIPNILGFSQH